MRRCNKYKRHRQDGQPLRSSSEVRNRGGYPASAVPPESVSSIGGPFKVPDHSFVQDFVELKPTHQLAYARLRNKRVDQRPSLSPILTAIVRL
jgi:hypothetical protein